MRRYWVLVAAVAMAACDPRSMFKAHADEAATAGEATLSAQQLADLLLSGKNVSLNRETADFVANVWVDYALLGEAVATGMDLTDSTTIAEAMWPQLAELRAGRWFDELAASRSDVSASAVDAAYNGTAVRLFQHILFPFPPNATQAQKDAALQSARGTMKEIQGGANFGALALARSQDPLSARDSGYLTPQPRGRFVPAFDSAGWTLAPGALSGLVETPYGIHIIRRPPLAEARSRMTAWLRDQQVEAVSTQYMDSLGLANKLSVGSGAAATIRAAVDDPDGYWQKPKTVATFTGGALDTRELLRWVRNFPPQMVAQIKAQPDSSLVEFAENLAQNVLLLRQADSAGVQPTAEEWTAIAQQYRAALDTLKLELKLTGDVTDEATDQAARRTLARTRVDEYFAEVVAARRRLRPLPQALGMVLRERLGYALRDEGLNAALDIARQAKAAATDSASAAGGAPAPSTGMPAPAAPPAGAPPAGGGE